MSAIAVLPRILGALFYYPATDERITPLLGDLGTLADLYPWPSPGQVRLLCHDIPRLDNETLTYQYSVLFEGQGEMPAPPWGSVYQDKDNLLMGETTGAYRRFLKQHQIALYLENNQPDDQFGLMLLVLAGLLEQGNDQAAITLLEEHLLPWAYRYLDLLQDNPVSVFYAQLAKIAALFLSDLERRHQLTPRRATLYR